MGSVCGTIYVPEHSLVENNQELVSNHWSLKMVWSGKETKAGMLKPLSF